MGFRDEELGGGTVKFPKGDYVITTVLRVPARQKTRLLGETGTRLIWKGQKGSPLFRIGDFTVLTVENMEIVYEGTREEMVKVPLASKFIMVNSKVTAP